jgi:hypothetical protein
LPGKPGDHVDEVVLLATRILVDRDPFAGTGAAQVDPAHRVPELVAEPLVLTRIARRDVVLAVRQILEQTGRGPVARRQVERGGEPYAVVHRDPHLVADRHRRHTLR